MGLRGHISAGVVALLALLALGLMPRLEGRRPAGRVPARSGGTSHAAERVPPGRRTVPPASRPRILLAISEEEYKTAETLTRFAHEVIERQLGFDTTLLYGDPQRPHVLPGLADALAGADLAIVSIRRRALPASDLEAVRANLRSGRPLVGIRTASHAFDTGGRATAGQAEWPTFDSEVLGGHYTGHHANSLKPRVTVNPGAESHPILSGIAGSFTAGGSLYKVRPLATAATPLLLGTLSGLPVEPVAWTHAFGKSRIFYTSLGHPDDFRNLSFERLLSNAVLWALDRPRRIEALPGTQPLALDGDIASQMVAGIDRFLLARTEQSFQRRPSRAPGTDEAPIEAKRRRLAHILGMRGPRATFGAPELAGTTAQPPLVGRGAGYEILAVRWPAFDDVHGEGLLLVPTGQRPVTDVVAIPDADQTPEQIVGLVSGVPAVSQFARRLAESGCRVVVPVLIDRRLEKRNGRALLTSREFLYRPAFELGRHLIGYELEKVLAAVDWLAKDAAGRGTRIGVIGHGEGGLLALHAAALDTRIDAASVSGYFDDRRTLWQEPIDRNVFGLLEEFGDAELAAMAAPRRLELTLPGDGGAPGRLRTPRLDAVRREVERARDLVGDRAGAAGIVLVPSGGGLGPPGTPEALRVFLGGLAPDAPLAPAGTPPRHLRASFDPAERQARQMHEIDRHNQWLLAESPYARRDFWNKLDTGSLETFATTIEPYRDFFRREVIGAFDEKLLEANPRTRKVYETARWNGYEVVLDVFPEVIAYGLLLVPKDIEPGERRPAVVCQHGLEGRPQEVVTGDDPYYHDFAGRLADRGFVVFAPQNPYIFRDRFRTLQRKANPLKKTLFSIIVPQHQQITDWLGSLPYVDPGRIAFYGLSYGGKSAMRIPALVRNYCLSICSADFNEWVWKNASSNPRNSYSYVWTGEYEIFEFDLGGTFNYAEMAALIAPRPFMVERGHFDGVAPDEMVAYEFAKVFHLYDARLGIGDRCRIEWFTGPHTIHGRGTFDFLHERLAWPKPAAR
jgi:dienelactone hydrolase/type 1 glutamine amidotransferase